MRLGGRSRSGLKTKQKTRDPKPVADAAQKMGLRFKQKTHLSRCSRSCEFNVINTEIGEHSGNIAAIRLSKERRVELLALPEGRIDDSELGSIINHHWRTTGFDGTAEKGRSMEKIANRQHGGKFFCALRQKRMRDSRRTERRR
jgi:hypothetical protein